MIRLKNLTIKNFLSIGNTTQGISFNREELILVLGENLDLGGEDAGSRNGCGKTAIMNALSYALFSWPISDIKKDHLVNLTNGKNMVVTLDFEANEKNYKIVRGLKPRLLEFYENGINQVKKEELIEIEDSSQGDSRDTQKEIEKIIGMSYDMFCQIVTINTYTQPFLFQKIADQRAIIEQLLGITLLSEKADKLKDEIKLARESMIQEAARIKAVETANKRIQSQIDSLVLKQKAWTKQKESDLTKLDKQIQKLSKIDIDRELSLHEQWDVYNSTEKDRLNLEQQKAQMQLALGKEQKVFAGILKDLERLMNQRCNTCNQKLETDTHIPLVIDATEKQKVSEQELLVIEESLKLLALELDKLLLTDKPEVPNYDTAAEAHDHRNKLMLITQEYQQREKDEDPYISQIESMRNSALEVIDMSELNALSKFVDHQEFLQKLLTSKDSFIRKKIIEQNLTYLNSRLNYYLTILGLPHEVVFQNDLSVGITELGRELSPGNLSRGEMTRLSLGLSFAFRDVWESLYQKISVLMIDESLDAGLDSSGTDNAIKLLRDMSREHHKDVWVISHQDELVSKCTSICRVIKENGFTQISFDE